MPRDIPFFVRLHLRLCSSPAGMIGLTFATTFYLFACIPATVVHDHRKFGAWLAVILFSLIGTVGLSLAIYAWFLGGKVIRLLKTGIPVQAKFYAVNLAGSKLDRAPVIDFEYQVEDKTYTVSTQTIGISRFTRDICQTVFYNPASPEQAVVLDNNIVFYETPERFDIVNQLRCMLALLAVAIICGAIITTAALIFR